jgi:hypothetical protein
MQVSPPLLQLTGMRITRKGTPSLALRKERFSGEEVPTLSFIVTHFNSYGRIVEILKIAGKGGSLNLPALYQGI